MKRWIFLAAFVVAVGAAFVLLRGVEGPPGYAELARSATASPDADPVELATPASKTSSAARTDVAVEQPAVTPAVAAKSSWTGVRVRVTALEDGKPLANVRLRARGPDGKQAWNDIDASHGTIGQEPRTGDDGLVELELAPGVKYALLARSHTVPAGPGIVEVDPPLVANEVRELALALPTKSDLVFHGRVVDRDTNAPIPNARVGRNGGWGKIMDPDEQRTDDDGRFHVASESWSRKVLNVLAPGYELAAVRPMAGHATAESALEIALSAVATVRVTVLDAAGAPMHGLSVTLSTAMHHFGRPDGNALVDAGWIDDAYFSAKTDAAGVAVVTDLPPRMQLDGVLYRGREEVLRAPEVLTLAPGEMRAVEWRVGGGCVLHGVALEADGRPANALSICLEAARISRPHYFETITSEPRRFAQTDGEGRFSFADVAAGEWWVGPAPKKFERPKSVQPEDPAPRALLVAVPPATPRVDVEVRVHRGLSITGRVLDPTGAPAPHASIVCARPAEKLAAQENMNDPQGRFVIGPLEPGEYELSAESHARFVASEPVRVRAGDTDVVLSFRAGGGLRGLVVDKASGQPMPASVLVRARTPTYWSVTLPTADAHGVFTLDGLAPGVYDVAASTSNGLVGLVTAVEVASGAPRDVRVEVVPGARVRVRYVGPWPHGYVSVLAGDAPVSTNGVAKGTEAVFAAPAGAVVVRLRSHVEQKDFDLRLTLAAGETRELVFDGAWK